ncbi:MAG: septal ring lytic transglycosylase RlpA family lipoprotein [Desulfuromonas sp.]|nr:MAG: septal ring lytic transglycosylase RlpA family lipoprotein [Desulfuromonas sp.]
MIKRCKPIFKLIIIIIVFFGLFSCGPSYQVSVVDAPDTRELKGHQKPYIVNGERYDPIRDHVGFVEEGMASWYGKKFHGRKTSNGEIYDMYASTAAHKTLPMGTYVRVTNKRNGKQTVVRVNDRGPFIAGRIIDLSYTAANEVGVVGPGTAPVRIEALGYREDKVSSGRVTYTQPQSYDIGTFAIQVGAFTVRSNADRLAADMRVQHGFATVREGWVDGKRFYRVWVGKFASLEVAEQMKLKLNGGFVVALE